MHGGPGWARKHETGVCWGQSGRPVPAMGVRGTDGLCTHSGAERCRVGGCAGGGHCLRWVRARQAERRVETGVEEELVNGGRKEAAPGKRWGGRLRGCGEAVGHIRRRLPLPPPPRGRDPVVAAPQAGAPLLGRERLWRLWYPTAAAGGRLYRRPALEYRPRPGGWRGSRVDRLGRDPRRRAARGRRWAGRGDARGEGGGQARAVDSDMPCRRAPLPPTVHPLTTIHRLTTINPFSRAA